MAAPCPTGSRPRRPLMRVMCSTGSAVQLMLLLAAGVSSTVAAPAGPGRSGPGSAAKGLDSKSVKAMLDLTPDPRDPHENGFVPREPGKGGIWAWGKVHATMHHVFENVPKGDPAVVADALDAFSTEYGLPFVVGSGLGSVLDAASRAAVSNAASQAAKTAGGATPTGMRFLAIGTGVGTRVLRCLPVLLENQPQDDDTWHEVVGIEPNWHKSDAGSQIMIHALGDVWGKQIRHTPLIPSEDTKLSEMLDTLRTGYNVKSFHFVMLGGADRSHQQEQLMSLLAAGALQPGAVVVAEGPSVEDPSTAKYMEHFKNNRHGSFKHEVHSVGNTTAVVSTLRGRDDEL